MPSLKIKLSTIQIAGALTAIAVGVIDAFIQKDAYNAILLVLVVEILTLSIDTYYGALGDSRRIQDTLRSHPVLKDYEYCIYEYPQLRDNFLKRSTVTLGAVLNDWMDEKIRLHQIDVQANWSNGRMYFPEQEVEGRTVQIQNSLQIGGFATQLEGYTEFWLESAEAYLAQTRQLAARGKDITRVFILRGEHSLKNSALITQMRMDKEAGIKTLVAFSNGPKKITDPEAVKDFGIWDNRLLCLVDLTHQTGEVTGCTYSVAEADLIKAGRWKQHILRHAEKADAYLAALPERPSS
ncbi:MAG TPA: hypothetical protein VG860_04605 [Terriglobia bacterium]|jgi:hypothetical protein|nr:hypothetical protein [Terriglobia bacterium]